MTNINWGQKTIKSLRANTSESGMCICGCHDIISRPNGCKECEANHAKIIYTSWGYDMTTVDYAKIIAETPAKVKCVMIGGRIENDNGQGNGRAYPNPEVVISEPFYLYKRGDTRQVKTGDYFRGKYPFCNGSKRMGTFWKYEGGGNYFNSWD